MMIKHRLKKYLAYSILLTIGVPIVLVFCVIACCLIVFDRYFGTDCNFKEV